MSGVTPQVYKYCQPWLDDGGPRFLSRILSRILALRVLEKYLNIFVSHKDILRQAKEIIHIASVLKSLLDTSSSLRHCMNFPFNTELG